MNELASINALYIIIVFSALIISSTFLLLLVDLHNAQSVKYIDNAKKHNIYK